MTEMEKVLRNRDGNAEGKEEYQNARIDIGEMIEEGCSYDDIEDYFLEELGLEMDYIFDIL